MALVVSAAEVLRCLESLTPDGQREALRYIKQLVEELEVPAEPPDIGSLVRSLADERWSVRHEAINALVSLGTPAVPALIDALGHPDQRVWRGAASALDRLSEVYVVEAVRGAPAGSIVPLLIEALGHPDEKVWGLAASLLWPLGEGKVVDAVKYALAGNAVPLATVESLRAAPALLRAATEGDPVIIQRAIHALACLGERVVPLLVQRVASAPLLQRLVAAEALGRLGAAPECVVDLGRSGDPEAGLAAAVFRAHGGDASVLEALLPALESADGRVRAVVARAVGRLGAPAGRALGRLRNLLGADEDRNASACYRDAIRRIERALKDAPAEMEASAAPAGRGTELEAV